MRFTSQDKKRPYTMGARLIMDLIPGPPAVWSMTIPETATQPGSDQGEHILCNAWFTVEVEAGDEFMNRCCPCSCAAQKA